MNLLNLNKEHMIDKKQLSQKEYKMKETHVLQHLSSNALNS